MTETLDMQWMAMKFQFGWMLGLSAWALALNLTFGLFNNLLKEWSEQIFPADSETVNRIFKSRWYLLIKFLLDKLARVKLPEQGRKPTGDTGFISKDPPASDPMTRIEKP